METLLASANIQTRCPNCQTVFEIGEDIVQGDDPRVRCGECLTIFDSKDNMLRDALSDDLLVDADDAGYPSATEVDLNNEKIVFEPDATKVEEVDFSDMDLFSDRADLPEVEYLSDSDEIPEIDFDTMDPDGDQFDGTLFDDVSLDDTPEFDQTDVWPVEPENETIVEVEADLDADLESLHQNEPVMNPDRVASLDPGSIPVMDTDDFADDEYDASLRVPEQTTSTANWGIRILLMLVLFLGLGGLYVYSSWQTLKKIEPFATARCLFIDCSTAQSADLEQLKVVRRSVYSHPKVVNALVINIVFRNSGSVAQDYPVLSIQMSDIRGKIVAMRDFKPFEYLKKPINEDIPMIKAGQTVDVSLEVKDPGDDAKSFELEFK